MNVERRGRACAASMVLAGLLGAACGGVLAQSSVTTYGVVSSDLVSATNVYTGTTKGSLLAINNGAVTASRLGFKGSEALGGGVSTIFGLESGFSSDNGRLNSPGVLFGRGAYVGVSGGAGTVTAGSHWNLNDDVMGNYFVFGGFAAFRWTEFDWLSDIVNNSVKYVSPVVGGFQGELLYGAGEQPGQATASRTVEAAASYGVGPFSAAVTYHQLKPGTSAFFPGRLVSGGASYKLDPVKLRLGYAASTPDTTVGRPKATTYDVGVDWYATSAFTLSVDYVARNQKGTGDDSHFVRLFGFYALSKRTALVGNVIALKNKGAATEHFYGDGSPGQSQNVVTLGIQHSF